MDYARDFSDNIKLSKFHLKKGDKFLYIFDFGDDWRFQIKVLRIIDESTETPDVLKSIGLVKQYNDDDEEGY